MHSCVKRNPQRVTAIEVNPYNLDTIKDWILSIGGYYIPDGWGKPKQEGINDGVWFSTEAMDEFIYAYYGNILVCFCGNYVDTMSISDFIRKYTSDGQTYQLDKLNTYTEYDCGYALATQFRTGKHNNIKDILKLCANSHEINFLHADGTLMSSDYAFDSWGSYFEDYASDVLACVIRSKVLHVDSVLVDGSWLIHNVIDASYEVWGKDEFGERWKFVE